LGECIVLAFFAHNEINKLRVLKRGRNSDSPASVILTIGNLWIARVFGVFGYACPSDDSRHDDRSVLSNSVPKAINASMKWFG